MSETGDERKNMGLLSSDFLEYERRDDEKDLEARPLAVRKQIDEKECDVKLKAFGLTDIYKLEVAFCGSHVVVKTECGEQR